MAMSATMSNHGKYVLISKAVNLATDSFKILLMRTGFVFNKDNHALKVNLKAVTGATALGVDEPTKKFTRAAGSFVTNGFVPGNKFTSAAFTNAGNNASTWIVDTVSATELVVTVSTGMVTEAAGGDETLTAEDELATGSGYTKDTKTLAGAALTEDDSNDYAQVTFSDVTWTASGGAIGPTPGAIIYSDTATDDPIIGYLDFGGEVTIADGNSLVLSNIRIRIS